MERQHYERAFELFTQALRRFQEADDEASIMQTYIMLGNIEQEAGRLAEAKAWYEHSLTIAQWRDDVRGLSVAMNHIASISLDKGTSARESGDATMAMEHFSEAARLFHVSLQMTLDRVDLRHEASIRSLLSEVYFNMGDLERAASQAHRARDIREHLGLMQNLPSTYHMLSEIAWARGDEAQVAQWSARLEEVEAELARRAQGDVETESTLSQEQLQFIAKFAVACTQAGLDGTSVSVDVKADFARLTFESDGPLQSLASYLRQLALGPANETLIALATPPEGLPSSLLQLFSQLRAAAIQDTSDGEAH